MRLDRDQPLAWELQHAHAERISCAQYPLSCITTTIERNDYAELVLESCGPSRTAPDSASYQHNHPNTRRFFQPRVHLMSTYHSAARLILKTITIRLTTEAGQHDLEARYELALNALAAA